MEGAEAAATAKQERDSRKDSALDAVQVPESDRRNRLAAQFLRVVVAAIGYLCLGINMAWPNVLASNLIHDNSTIFHTQLHLSNWQMDMTGSMMFMGSLPGFLISGWLVGRLGRRWSLLLSVLPNILGSLMTGLAYNTHMLLSGRFLGGMTFGMLSVAGRTYASEISDNSIRGASMAVFNLMMQIGSLLVIGLGIGMTWYQVMFVNVSVSLLYCFFVATILPESPSFLVVHNRDDKAAIVLRRLRGPYADVDKELSLHKQMNQRADGTSGWSALLKLDVIKRVIIMSGLFFISNFSGVQVLKANTTRMLQSSTLALDQDVSTIIVYVVLFLGNFTMSLLLDRVGRRRCMTLSLTIIMMAYATFGIYMFFNSGASATEVDIVLQEQFNATLTYQSVSPGSQGNWTWVPLLCLMTAAFGQSCGAGPIPWLLSTEYFPTFIRSQAVSVCTLIGGLLSFLSLQLYSPMQEHLTQAGLYWTYGSVAALGIPYVFIFIQETRGKSVG